MDRQTIIDSMHAWSDISKDAAAIISYFDTGNRFHFILPDYASGSSHIHAYPGIYNGKLGFFMIPTEYDKTGFSENFNDYVTYCPLMTGHSNGSIPEPEALLRINTWNSDYEDWIRRQVNDTVDGIFMAFTIPRKDFVSKDVNTVYMALYANGERVQPYTADMITTNIDGTSGTNYEDFARPIPPYGISPSAAASSFYLLTL